MAAAPPMAEAKELMMVTPICTVARKRSGPFFRRATAEADLMPFSSRASMRLLRVAIIAISAAAKKPLARIKTKIRTASNHISSRVIVASPSFHRLWNQGKQRRSVEILTRSFDRDGEKFGDRLAHS